MNAGGGGAFTPDTGVSSIIQLRKISAISSETEVPGIPFITPTKYFWLRVFGAPTICVISVANPHFIFLCFPNKQLLTYWDAIDASSQWQIGPHNGVDISELMRLRNTRLCSQVFQALLYKESVDTWIMDLIILQRRGSRRVMDDFGTELGIKKSDWCVPAALPIISKCINLLTYCDVIDTWADC